MVFQRKTKYSTKSAAGFGNSQFCPPVIEVLLRLSSHAHSFCLWSHTSLFFSADNYSHCCPLFWPASDECFCPVTDNSPCFLSYSEAWPPWYFQSCVCVRALYNAAGMAVGKKVSMSRSIKTGDGFNHLPPSLPPCHCINLHVRCANDLSVHPKLSVAICLHCRWRHDSSKGFILVHLHLHLCWLMQRR